MFLFDPELGRSLRAIWTLVLAVVIAIIALLQAVIDTAEFLPDWEILGAVILWLRAVVSVLTSFTKIGNPIDTQEV